MSETKKLFANTSYLLIGHVINSILSFFLIVAIARYLGDEGLGIYSFAFAFVGFFSLFSGLGEVDYAIKQISRNKKIAHRYESNVAGLDLFLAVASTLLSILVITITGSSWEHIYIVILASIAGFFISYSKIFIVLFRSYEVMGYESIGTVIERTIALIFGLVTLWKGYGLEGLVIVLVFSNMARFIYYFITSRRKILRFGIKFDFRLWKHLIKNGLSFWLSGLFINIYFKIDTIMLGYMTSYAVVGWYNAAYKIIDMLSKIPFIINSAVFPVMARFYSRSKETLGKIFSRLFYYLFIIAVPIGIGGWYYADKLILFVFKSQFSESIIALKILIWALSLIFINYLMGVLLNSIDKQKIFTVTIGITMVFNILLNLLLIPRYSYVGAAYATLITEMLNFGLLYYLSSKNGFRLNLWICIRPIVAGLAMLVLLYYMKNLSIYLSVAVCAVFYFMVLFIIRGFSNEDYNIARHIIK